MIELHGLGTPNGKKASVMLEEVGLPYEVRRVDITKDEQFKPAFLKISPNNKIPAIVDPDGPGGKPMSLFETGAILIYLADKTGKLLAKDGPERYTALQWLMWQMGGFGPMLGQANHFIRFAKEKVPYAIARYGDEAKRLYGVLDRRLGEAEYLAGDAYTIADVAAWPWAANHEMHGIDLAGFANARRWFEAVGARPAVQRGDKAYG